MAAKGVLISYDYPLKRSSISASGILFQERFILTQGTILSPLLNIPAQSRWIKLFLKKVSSKLERNDQLESNVKFRAYQETPDRNVVSLGTDIGLVGAWKCPLVSRSSAALFHDWTFGDVNREKNLESEFDYETSKDLMSVFIVLRTGISDKKEKGCDLSELFVSLGEPNRGESVLIESTPFGSEIFFNSVSRGILSNLVGSQKCLMLTDARTITGCEGGPIYATNGLEAAEKGKLLGIVSQSLTWWRGEWVGLTIGINLEPVLRRLLTTPNRKLCLPQPNFDNAVYNTQDIVDETVVLVQCGSSWGSGVVLDAQSGIIITCSHVLGNESARDISIFHKGAQHTVKAIFRTRDGLAYDLAILKLTAASELTKQVELADHEAQKGETVIAAGFPLLSQREDPSIRPTLVHGCVARTCPFMLQTTCCIQSGASGGAVLKEGKLVGIIVCNTKDSSSGALFPHVSFAVPTSAFRESISKYVETGDLRHLQDLESCDGKVQSLWMLRDTNSKL